MKNASIEIRIIKMILSESPQKYIESCDASNMHIADPIKEIITLILVRFFCKYAAFSN
jgi:hypothetical protein